MEQANVPRGEFSPVPSESDSAKPVHKIIVRRVLMLAVTGVGLYLVWPSLVAAFSTWPDLATLDPTWLLAIGLLEASSFFCMWLLLGLVLRTKERFLVSTSQLAGNAAGRILPGGPAVGGALQFQMLRDCGLDAGAIGTGLGVASALITAVLAALPLPAIPPILAGVPVHENLVDAVWIGSALFGVIFVGGAAAPFLDRLVVIAGRLVRWVGRRLHRSRPPAADLPEVLLVKRNEVRQFLGMLWRRALLATAGKVGFDYLALVSAVAAVGVRARPSLILLAFVAAGILGMIPITPGGLGFVEVGLTATLVLAGVPSAQVFLATLAYRLFSYWLPLPAGLVAYNLFRRRYPAR